MKEKQILQAAKLLCKSRYLTNPLFGCVKIKGDLLYFTNYQSHLKHTVGIRYNMGFSPRMAPIYVNAMDFATAINKIKCPRFFYNKDKNKRNIKITGLNGSIILDEEISSTDLSAPPIHTKHCGDLKYTEVANIIRASKYIADDELRPAMSCVYYDSPNRYIVGSDAHRLIMIPYWSKDKHPGILFPLVVIKLLNIFGINDYSIYMQDKKNQTGSFTLMAKGEINTKIITDWVDDFDYPKYQLVWPKEKTCSMSVDKTEFLQVLDNFKGLDKWSGGVIISKTGPSEASLTHKSHDDPKFTYKLSASFKGRFHLVFLKPALLIPIIKDIPEKTICIEGGKKDDDNHAVIINKNILLMQMAMNPY